jgi:hypothetical protein
MSEKIENLLHLSEEEIFQQLKSFDDLNIDVNLDDLSSLNDDDVENDVHSNDKSIIKKASLKKAWRKINHVTCTIYKENPKIGDKELIDAVIAALGITGQWEIVLVALALKKGLNKICNLN